MPVCVHACGYFFSFLFSFCCVGVISHFFASLVVTVWSSFQMHVHGVTTEGGGLTTDQTKPGQFIT